MNKFMPRNSEKGFSLVELMIVVGIIGVLATLALPRFKQFQAKAKMGEAKNMLSHIFTLEQSYSLDNNRFEAFSDVGRLSGGNLTDASCNPAATSGAGLIGFRIDPCVPGGVGGTPTPRYNYSAVATSSTFTATATSGAGAVNLVCPGNNAHSFTLNHQNVFVDPGMSVCMN